jgi:hypothetical protein
LRVFLCHASDDKPRARDLYGRLKKIAVIEPWLDEENILPGQDWDREIRTAIADSDLIIVCLSSRSVNKEGYVQREILIALNQADEKPEGTIFVVPIKLEDCDVPPPLRRWQWLDWRDPSAGAKLSESLRKRASALGIPLRRRRVKPVLGDSRYREQYFSYTIPSDQLSDARLRNFCDLLKQMIRKKSINR